MGKKQKKKLDKQKPAAPRQEEVAWFFRPHVGNYLTIAAAVALQFTIILLPLVGPAGAVVPHANKNAVAWVAVAVLALLLSGTAFYSKWQRHRQDGSPVPIWSVGLCVVSTVLLLAFVSGALRA